MIQAAKYLGVAPWELDGMAFRWYDLALLCMSIEHELNTAPTVKRLA